MSELRRTVAVAWILISAACLSNTNPIVPAGPPPSVPPGDTPSAQVAPAQTQPVAIATPSATASSLPPIATAPLAPDTDPPLVLHRSVKRQELNETYTITRYRQWIVTGTQGGVVVWNPRTGHARQARPEFICSSLLVHNDVLWAGCYHSVIRYDGTKFEVRMTPPGGGAGETSFELMHDTHGEMVLRHGTQWWHYETANDKFMPWVGVGSGYDVLISSRNETWRIDFLHAIERGTTKIGLRSAQYPGRDPRRFYEDSTGRLWVCDFDDGFFWLENASGTFVKEPGWDNKGSAVQVDAARGRTWLGHYTTGVLLKEAGGRERVFNFPQLKYMRDIYVDVDGSLWVGGWTALVHLFERGSDWSTLEMVLR